MSDLGNKEIMARNIKRYMELKNVDRNQMCKDLGIKYTTLCDWLNGNTYPRIDKIELMANYFHISKADLVEGVTEIHATDPDVRRIERARKNMPDDDWDFMMSMITRSFPEYFEDDGSDDPD